MSEPSILINGVHLTDAQASTVRCAIESLASLIEEDAHGPCEIGNIGHGYMMRIAEIRGMIFRSTLIEMKYTGTPGLRNYEILEEAQMKAVSVSIVDKPVDEHG